MNRKLEIRSRMAELQREFSSLNTELKEMETLEKAAIARERYKEYQFKVGIYGYKLDPAEKLVEVTEEDREQAFKGKSGLIYTNYDRDFGFVMLKSREEHARVARVCEILSAVEALANDDVRDKEPHIKVILGE
jgi:hypothetical protein